MLRIHARYDDGSRSSSKSSTSSHLDAGAIAGSVIGTLAGLILMCSVFGYFLYRRRNNIRNLKEGITAYEVFARPDPGLHTASQSCAVTHTGKVALHREEFDRLQRPIGGFHGQSIAESITSTSVAAAMNPTADVGGNTESELAHQIAELRMEVADLRMRPPIDVPDNFPPPQYEQSRSDIH